ncbi:MAG: AraC family transcriptional regulator [Gammaproteobacteria bacterium]
MDISAHDLERLFDALPDVVFFVKDWAGRYSHANQTLLARLGLARREDLVGKRASDLFPAGLGSRYDLQDRKVLAGEIIRDELELHLFPNHAPGWCLSSKRPLRVHGEIRGLVGLSRDLGRPDLRHPDYGRLRRLVEHLETHYGEPTIIGDLARELRVSVSQLERLSRRVFHLTPGQLLGQIRIEAAMRHLALGGRIAQVALASGFGDQSAFARKFKAQVGLTPRAYQTLARSGGSWSLPDTGHQNRPVRPR